MHTIGYEKAALGAEWKTASTYMARRASFAKTARMHQDESYEKAEQDMSDLIDTMQ